MKLLKSLGRVEIKSLGIVLTQSSSSDEIERAIKHTPVLKKYVEQVKKVKNDESKK